MTQRHASPPGCWFVPARLLALAAVTALSVDIAHQSAQADPLDPGDLGKPGLIDELARPILWGDFDANSDGVSDQIFTLPPDTTDTRMRVGILHGGDDTRSVIPSEQTNDLFGAEVARGVGDLNGDGRDDLIVTTQRWHDAEQVTESFVTIFSGADGQALFTLTGDAPFDTFGRAAGPVGDINGDGTRDILVGAPGGGANAEGYAEIRSGLDGQIIRTHVGITPNSGFGHSVVGLGDVDGDRCADYAVGAPGAGANDQGGVYLYSGATGGMIRTLTGNQGEAFGLRMSSAADMNHDGVAELIVEAPFAIIEVSASGATVRQGRAVVVSGVDGAILDQLIAPEGMALGSVRGTVFDVDGDGAPDMFAIGAQLVDPSDMSSMTVLAYSGASRVLIEQTPLVNTGPASVTDLNHDGFTDTADLSEMLLAINGRADAPEGDLDHDEFITARDVALLLDDLSVAGGHTASGDEPAPQPALARGARCTYTAGALGGAFIVGLFFCTGNYICCHVFGVCYPCFGYLFDEGLTAATAIGLSACAGDVGFALRNVRIF